MSLLHRPCRHCGQTAGRLILFAMMQDAGAKTSNDAVKCWAREDGGDHDFTETEKEKA